MLTQYDPSHISLTFATDSTTLGHIPRLIQAPLETDLSEWRQVLAKLNIHYPEDHEFIFEAQDIIQALEVQLIGSRVRLAIALRAQSKAQKAQLDNTFEKCKSALLNSPAMKLAIAHVDKINLESLSQKSLQSIPQKAGTPGYSVDAATLAQDMMHFLYEIHMSQQEAIDNPERAISSIIKLW